MTLQGSYLIQRLEPPRAGAMANVVEAFSFGGGMRNGGLSEDAMELLRPIFSFDYMGAAEFEFGAIPETLNKLREFAVNGELESFEVELGSAVAFVIAPTAWHEEVEQRLFDLASIEPPRTKEYVGFRDALTTDDPRFVGWLEISNGFFFFVDRDAFVQTATLFGVAP